jgi:prefoldin subunit 5
VILSQQEDIRMLSQENNQLRQQLTALATELAQLRERIGQASTRPKFLRLGDLVRNTYEEGEAWLARQIKLSRG